MAGDLVIFVSKRLQRPAAAILCIIAAQLALAVSSPEAAQPQGAVRVAIGR
jgi:hypothetical protein